MAERDCKNCVRNKPDVGCTSWDCDYINRQEAIEAWKEKYGTSRTEEKK